MATLRLGNPTNSLLSTEDDETVDPFYLTSQAAYRRDVLNPQPTFEQPKVALAQPQTAVAPEPQTPRIGGGMFSYIADSAAPAKSEQKAAPPVGGSMFSYLQQPSTPVEEPKKDDSGDTSRGFSAAIAQTPALLKGAVGYIGAVGEKTLGEGGNFSALRQWGLEGYQKGMKEIQAKSKDTDELTTAWDKAKKGDLGALVDWAQYGIGYLGGNLVETVGTSILGGLVGSAAAPGAGTVAGAAGGVVAKDAVKGVAKSLIESMVAKETAKLVEKAGVETATDAIIKQATKNVAKGIGSATALAGSSILKGTGGIYGEAVEQAGGAANLDGGDLARIFGAGVVAGVSEFALDKLGLDAAAGKIKIPGGGRVGRALIGGAAGTTLEGGQELFQTAVERFGAGKDLTSEDAIKDYINSAALGGLGGGIVGSASGALRGDPKPPTPSPSNVTPPDAPDTTAQRARFRELDAIARGADSLTTPTGETVELEKRPLTESEVTELEQLRQQFAATEQRNSAGFVPEPAEQVQAQVDAVIQGRKPAAVVGLEEAQNIDAGDLFRSEITDPTTGQTSVLFSQDPNAGELVQQRVNEIGFQPAMGEALGLVDPTVTTNPVGDEVVVQQRDNQSGQVITEQAVSPERVAEVAPIEGTTTNVTTVEQTKADRTAEADAAPVVTPDAPVATPTAPAVTPAAPATGQQSAQTEQTPAVTAQETTVTESVEPKPAAKAEEKPAPKKTVEQTLKEKNLQKGRLAQGKKQWRTFAPEGVKWEDLTPEAQTKWADAVADGKPNMALADELSPTKKTKEQEAADAKIDTMKVPTKVAIEFWEDQDDGTVAHVSWAKLSKDRQRDWKEAVEDGYASADLHDRLVAAELQNQRAERTQAKAAANAKREEAGDAMLRTTETKGEPLSVEALEKLVAQFKANWVNMPEVKVVASEEQLPVKIRGEIVRMKAEGRAPGLYRQGKVYLIASNIRGRNDAILTIVHETAGHFGLRSTLGENMATMMRDLYNGNKFVRQQADAMMAKEDLPLEHAVEEVLADIAEGKLKSPEAKGALAKLYAALRKWLRDTFKVPYVSDDTLRQIVANARRYVEDGSVQAGPGGAAAADAAVKQALARARAETFYSAMERAFKNPKINLDKNGATSGAQWKAWLNSKKGELGVKDAEIEWTGINNWFDLNGSEKLTKQQVLSWIAGNRVKLNEVRLVSYGRPDELAVGVAEFVEPSEDDMREFVRDQQEGMDPDENPDAVATSPDDMSGPEMREWIAENYGWQNYMARHRRQMERFQRGRIAKMTRPKHSDGNLVLPGGRNHAEIALFDPTVDSYKETDDIHYGDVTKGKAIGWFRANERKDIDGNDVLFLEELQSQRGQDGRDVGFFPKGQTGTERTVRGRWVDYAKENNLPVDKRKGFIAWFKTQPEYNGSWQWAETMWETINRGDFPEDTKSEKKVPAAPFVEETRSWTALLLKRAIAYAQERGIDRIAWTTGEQQNARYAFPGDELVYVKEKGKDNITLTVMKGGRNVRTVDVKADQLAAFVGDRAAERINANEGVQLDNEIETSGSLKGDDLKVMEANLQPFYNQTVPSVAKDVLKKFGGKVEVMNIEGTGQQLGFVIPQSLQQVVEEDGLPMFRRKDYEAQYDDLDPVTREIALKKGHYSPPTIRQRLESLKPDMWKRVVQGTFDRFRAIRDIDQTAYQMARVSEGASSGVEGLLHFGQVYDDDGALNVKKGTKGLLEILKPVGGEVDRFLLWVAANRAANLKKEDRERFFSEDEIKALQKLNLKTLPDGKSRAGVYAEVLQGMNALNRSVLEVAKSAGHIDEAAFKRFAADIWYVPFYRIMEEDGSLAGARNSTSSALVGQYLSKKLKGSERPLDDLMQNVLLNWSHILSASMKNKAANETLNSAVEMGGIVTKLDKAEKGAVQTMVGGKEQYWRVDDPLLLTSLQALSSLPSYGYWTTLARNFKTTLTRFISLSPTFKINNLIRDSIQSAGLTELSKNPVANVIQGWRAYEDERAEALVGGGLFAMGNAFDGDQTANVKRLLKMGVKDADILTNADKTKNFFKKVWSKYDEISDKAENANRLALYQQLRSKGASHLEATYAARDLQDFGLQGSWAAIRYASMILPYFNARLQGMYKLGRDGIAPSIATLMGNANESERQKAAKFATVLSGVVAVGVALYLSQKDDEDWKKREEWDKDAFFWFKLPGTDVAVRIPKPFEMGAVSTIVERLVEQIVDKDVEGKVFGKRLLAVLHDNLAMNPIPQIVRPLYDLARNKDGFTDRPIESMGMERLSPEYRINAGTSGAGVALGTINSMFAEFVSAATGGAVTANSLKMSPIQYDYLLRGYLGWLGTVIQTVSSEAAAPFKPGERPDRKIDDILVIGNYVKSMPQSQSRWVTSFYENAKEIATATADYRAFVAAGDAEKAAAVMDAKQDKIALNKMYTKVTEKLSTISKQIKAVQADEEMGGAEKRVQIDRLNALRIEYAKAAEEVRIARSRGE